jgi:hypothetical protein
MPIRPENRDRYPADWLEIRARILHRAERWIPGSMDIVPRCECHGECGRGTHDGQCPNINGGLAYGSGAKVVTRALHGVVSISVPIRPPRPRASSSIGGSTHEARRACIPRR